MITISEIRQHDMSTKEAWLEYFVSELADYEGVDYVLTLDQNVDNILQVFEQQGYWAGNVRRYFWVPELVAFITEGR
jgi:hypothetical protein